MQRLARDGYNDDQILRMLHSPAMSVDFGAELLNLQLEVVQDISGDVSEIVTSRTMGAVVHGQVSLEIARPLRWGVDFVQTFMRLRDGLSGVSARFDTGVYSLTTPTRTVGESLTSYKASGFDRLVLLQREVGADYNVALDVTYRQALLDTFAAAGLSGGVLIEGAAADRKLPKARSWPLIATSTDPDQVTTPVTWLRVINDLLQAINFRGVWADERGRYRCQAYANPKTRPSEFLLSTDRSDPRLDSIVGPDRSTMQDVWGTPNRWTARATNPPAGVVPSETNGLVQIRNNVSDGITSQQARGGLIYAKVLDYETADASTLANRVDRRVALDLQATATYEITTAPLPIAGHDDVVTIRDPEAEITTRAQATSWRLPHNGDDMSWSFELLL